MKNAATKRDGDLKVDIAGDREIVITRAFDAPRRLVFDAFTKPELVKRWLYGPPGWEMVVCEIDLRVGGAYRFVLRKGQETEMGWGGVYREVIRPERFVATERFDEAWYPGESVVVTAFVEKDGKTTLTQTLRYESREARDAVLKSGMESGLAAGYDRLAQLLASPVS